jgi:hypothetical protein
MNILSRHVNFASMYTPVPETSGVEVARSLFGRDMHLTNAGLSSVSQDGAYYNHVIVK